jgi:hypothetical protein
MSIELFPEPGTYPERPEFKIAISLTDDDMLVYKSSYVFVTVEDVIVFDSRREKPTGSYTLDVKGPAKEDQTFVVTFYLSPHDAEAEGLEVTGSYEITKRR